MVPFKEFWLSMQVADRDEFARRCESTRPHLNNVAYGSRVAGEKLAIAIDRESAGKVRCEDLRPDVDWAYLRANVGAAA